MLASVTRDPAAVIQLTTKPQRGKVNTRRRKSKQKSERKGERGKKGGRDRERKKETESEFVHRWREEVEFNFCRR